MADRKRTALIVGASRGLGLGLATELARRGWQVIATVRSAELPGELATAVAKSAGHITTAMVDVDSTSSVDGLVASVSRKKLDLLFINAGIAGPKHQSVDEVTPAELAALFTTNAIAPVRIARRLLPNVVDGGCIAFMSSRMGSVADNLSGGMDLYRASKAALNSLTRSFVSTVAHDRKVTVLTLHPGWVRTDMGGAAAPLSIADSVSGLANVIEAPQVAKHRFLDYQGAELPW
jgi:NAD(P)-dependent dehydrogenase (short-subunit alcohol dehydrogenase family)